MYITIALAIMAALGLGVAAENSTPGNPLYPAKVNVNENLRAATSLSTESKARWEADRAERRVEEMTQLSAEGKLDAEVALEEKARFEEHRREAEKYTAELRAEGNVEAAAEIDTRLRALSQTSANVGINASAAAGLNLEL